VIILVFVARNTEEHLQGRREPAYFFSGMRLRRRSRRPARALPVLRMPPLRLPALPSRPVKQQKRRSFKHLQPFSRRIALCSSSLQMKNAFV